MNAWIAGHRKGLIAVLGVVLNAADIAYGYNPYVILAVNLATAAGVYQVPNEQPAKVLIFPPGQMGLSDPTGR
jgi:hypothetical protein